MIGRSAIAVLLATLLMAAPALADPLYTDDPDNPARVGAWRVSCDHDGNLHGRDVEACGAWAKVGGSKLWFYRNPQSSSVRLETPGCSDAFSSDMVVANAGLDRPGKARVAFLAKALAAVSVSSSRTCKRRAPAIAAALDPKALAQVLELTDGLQNFGANR